MTKQLTEDQAKKIAALNKPMSVVRSSLQNSGYDITQAEQAIINAQKGQLSAAPPAPTSPPATSSTTSPSPPAASQPSSWKTDWAPMAEGFKEGMGELWQDVKNIPTKETLGNLASAATNPTATLQGGAEAIAGVPGMIKDAWNDPKKAGKLAADVVGLAVPGKAAGKISELGKVGKVVGKAGEALTTGKAAPAVMAAADPSLKDKSEQDKARAVGGGMGAQVAFHAMDSALGKGLGMADKAVTGGKIGQMLPADADMLKTAAGRAAERLRSKGIQTVGKLSPVDLAAYAVGKGVKLMVTPNAFMKNANTGRGDLVKLFAEQLEITPQDLKRLGYNDQELKALEAKNKGAPIMDALGHVAVEEITPEVIKASRMIINDRYGKFWENRTVNLDGNGLSKMAGDAYGALRTVDNVKQLDGYLEHAAPGLMAPNGKFIAQRMSGPEFQKMRSEISTMAHDLSSRINGPNASAADIKLKPVAQALHTIKDHFDKMAENGMSANDKLTLKGLRKTYQAVSDFDGVMREGKLGGNVYMSPIDMLDYVRRSNPDRFTRTLPGDETVELGRDFETLGIESKPRGLVTKYGQRRYARGRNAVVNAAAIQKQDDQ